MSDNELKYDPEDETEDDEFEDDEDIDLDDEETLGARRSGLVRPFSTSSSPSASDTSRPGDSTGRTSYTGSRLSGSGNLPGGSGYRSPTAGGSSAPPAGGTTYGSRPTTPGSGPTSSGTTYGSRPTTPGSSSPTSGSGSSYGSNPGSGGSSTYGNRPTTPGSGPTSGGGSTYGSRPTTPGSGSTTPGGGSTYGSRPTTPGSPTSGGSSAPGAASSAPAKPAESKPEAKDEKKGLLGNIGGVTQGISGLRSKLPGGGDKKDDKPAAPKPGGGSNPLSQSIGGLRSRFSGGDKKDDKPAAPKTGGGSNPLSQSIGGLRSRFSGGDKKDDKPAASVASSSARPSTPSSGSAPASSSSSGARTPLFGGGRSSSPPAAASSSAAAAKAPAKKGPSLGERLKAALPFGGAAARKGTTVREKVERASKAPKIDESGLTLDNKLDILGVALLLGSLALFFSSMSSTQGQLTQPVLQTISRLFGWGGIAVPVAMFGAGMWLIVRHFGDEAPMLDMVRLSGLGLLYLSTLTVFQYVDSFQSYYTLALLEDFLRLSIEAGRGGGWVGAQLYSTLVLNITELGGMFALAGMIVIGCMLTLRISAAELAVFVISIVRSFNTALQRRAQARAARARLRAQEQAAARLAAPAISVSKPAAAELGDGKAAAALPAAEAPSLPEPRPIPITKGGKTVTAFFDGTDPVPVESAPAAESSGLASRLFSALPLSLPGATKSEPAAEEKPRTGLFNRVTAISGRDTGAEAAVKPADKPVDKPADHPADKPADKPSPYAPPAASVAPVTPAPAAPPAASSPPSTAIPVTPASTEPPPARLGDLMRPAASAAPPAVPATPFAASAAPGLPALPEDKEKSESEELRSLPPATPKGTPPRPATPNPFAPRPATPAASSPPPAASKADDEDEDKDDEQLNLEERRQRLNALRSGQLFSGTSAARPTPPAASSPVPPEKPAAGVIRSTPPPVTPAQPPAAYKSDEARPPAPKINYVDQPAASTTNGTSPANPVPFRRPDTPPATPAAMPRRQRDWRLPDYKTLLNPGSETDFDRQVLLDRARTIEETLLSFGAPGRVVEVNTGPVITQFGVEPDYLVTRSGKKNRVKVGAIAQLDKDLQLALGAKSIRIEAPVPGKGYVGIEVPNEEASLVSLRDVMEADSFQKILKKSPLAIALGQSVDGAPIAADLGSMPHLLIAGTTGSGKSVCVNAIITSIILNNKPDKVKFIMVDPKRVELTGYNGIPHLVAPVVVDLERTVGVLKWVTREMDERYKQFSNAGARNIEDFNNHLAAGAEHMPYIVVIIDELADLMMLAPDETERVITRIAALARATGIHLVIATQRPSVDVVTGLIKANFPARIAFAVAGGVDSRVILDQPGAERLLGKGDMLYLSGDSPAALRLQGVYVSDAEINNITRYWKMQAGDDIATKPLTALMAEDSSPAPARSVDVSSASRHAQSILWDADDDDDADDLPDDDDGPLGDERDELYDQAVEMVRRLNKASVSLLQRRLRIGYTRAARLIDMMEEEGIVGPAQEGSKPREVLMSPPGGA